MSNDSSSYSSGVGFFGMLTILFIGLKLGGVINWSWLWVLSPFLIPISIFALLACVMIIALIISGGTR